MKYLAAYLLLVQGGNAAPSAADIKSVVESVGAEVDEARINELLSSLEGKGSLEESSLKVKRSSLASQLVVLLLVLLPVLPVLLPVVMLLKKKRKKKLRKNLMMTWDSVYSIKEFNY